MINKMNLLAPALALTVMLMTGCTKEPLNHLNSEESRIYVTDHDSSVNFTTYHTFSIADSAAVIDGNNSKKALTDVDQAYINAIKSSMQDRGFALVEKNQNPDIVINVNRIYSTSTGVISYTDYWDYYGGYWDPGYWGYPGYGYYVPYTYGVYQVTEGLISIDMFDRKNAATSGKLNLLWNGLVRGEGIFTTDNAGAAVKALFDQSPYLKASE